MNGAPPAAEATISKGERCVPRSNGSKDEQVRLDAKGRPEAETASA